MERSSSYSVTSTITPRLQQGVPPITDEGGTALYFWSIMLGVMSHKYVKGVGSLSNAEDLQRFKDPQSLHQTYDLDTMLFTQFYSDAHFTCYHLKEMQQWPLLRKSVLQDIREENSDIYTSYYVFDWDNPKSVDPVTGKPIKTPWSEALYAQFLELMNGLQDHVLRNFTSVYTTRNGARIIYRLTEPVPVDIAEQNLVWMIQHFRRNGIPTTNEDGWGIDHSCRDWTRRFRCPKVIRDDTDTSLDWPGLILPSNGAIDPSIIGRAEIRTLAKQRYYKKEDQGQCPTFDHLQGFLYKAGNAHRTQTMTGFHKRAKQALKQSEYFDMLFADIPPAWNEGTRNDEIMRMLGMIVPPLIRQCGAKTKECMALAILPVQVLEHTHGIHPVEHAWNALLDIYEREIGKLNSEEEAAAKQASMEVDTLNDMVVGMREWCDAPQLVGEEVMAREFARNHILASFRNSTYLMNHRGYYDPMPLGKDQVISRIRKSYLGSLIPTTREGVKNEIIDVSIVNIQNKYSTTVFHAEMRPMGDKEGFIKDLDGHRPKLVLSMYKRNSNLVPEYSEIVDAWLHALFGEMYEAGIAWIGQALAFEEGPICALSLLGEPGAGKKLFMQGLAECLEEPYFATGDDLICQSSALIKTPFLNINEDWPKGSRKGSSPADTFKKLTGGDVISIDEKFQPVINITNPVRVVLTANDKELLKELTKGRDMSLDTRIAIGRRVLHINIPQDVKVFMASIGNRKTTAKPGERWVSPESGTDPSNFVLAKMFLYLYATRQRKTDGARFLITGNCSPTDTNRTDVFSDILTSNTRTTNVCHAIHMLLESKNPTEQRDIKISQDGTRLFVTRSGIYRNIKGTQNERITQGAVLHALLNLMVSKDPEIIDGMDWYEIDVNIMNNYVNSQGISPSRVRNIYEAHRKMFLAQGEVNIDG